MLQWNIAQHRMMYPNLGEPLPFVWRWIGPCPLWLRVSTSFSPVFGQSPWQTKLIRAQIRHSLVLSNTDIILWSHLWQNNFKEGKFILAYISNRYNRSWQRRCGGTHSQTANWWLLGLISVFLLYSVEKPSSRNSTTQFKGELPDIDNLI